MPATLLTNALREVVLVEGQNTTIERRLTEGDLSELPRLARELVSRKPDLIVAFWNQDVLAAMQATRSIPIVMVVSGPDWWRVSRVPAETSPAHW